MSSLHRLSLILLALLALAAPAAAAPLKIMPLGDSITAGTGSTGASGYMKPLAAQLNAAGVAFDFVGSAQGGYAADPDHEGHGGYASADILNGKFAGEGVSNWLNRNPADVVLLMVGYNDVFNSVAPAQFSANLAAILDAIRAFTPSGGQPVKVVLARLGAVTNGQQAQVNALNAAIDAVYNQRKAQGGLWLVDMSTVLAGQGDLADIVHPNDAGYAKMAPVWMQGLRAAGAVPAAAALKVMPVGDSLTAGSFSSDGAGYEKTLEALLTQNGTAIDFVGSKTNGYAADPEHEGYGRYTSGDVLNGTPGDAGGNGRAVKEPGPGIAARLAQFSPDAVLLLIGLNDVFDGLPLSTTTQDLNGILDAMAAFGSSRGRPVTTLLAKLTPVTNGQQPQVDAINAAIQGIYDQRKAQGNLTLVDMSAVLEAQDYALAEPVAHPNDAGYVKMAQAWFAGFQAAGLTAGASGGSGGSGGGDAGTGGADGGGSGGQGGTGASSTSSGSSGGGGCAMADAAGFDPALLLLAGAMGLRLACGRRSPSK